MKATVIYIEREKAKRIIELLRAEKEFLTSNNHDEAKHDKTIIRKKS